MATSFSTPRLAPRIPGISHAFGLFADAAVVVQADYAHCRN